MQDISSAGPTRLCPHRSKNLLSCNCLCRSSAGEPHTTVLPRGRLKWNRSWFYLDRNDFHTSRPSKNRIRHKTTRELPEHTCTHQTPQQNDLGWGQNHATGIRPRPPFLGATLVCRTLELSAPFRNGIKLGKFLSDLWRDVLSPQGHDRGLGWLWGQGFGSSYPPCLESDFGPSGHGNDMEQRTQSRQVIPCTACS